MGDPELRSDEKVLVRTPGVYVKSIPFEGILTNKRIILIDRAKNLLPPKEIPLITIKEVESGENAIRDQIVTLSVMAKTGETRQMILTFSRQAGGNRIKERDAWIKIIRENASSSFDQVIRNVIPRPEAAPRRTEPAAGQRYEADHSPLQQPAAPTGYNRLAGTGMDDFSPVRRVVTAGPAAPVPPAPVARQPETPVPGPTVFCPKCGNRVPADSVFCNRCGSSITPVPPVSMPVQTPAAPAFPRTPAARPIDEEIQSIEPLIERSTDRVPAAPVEPRVKHTTYSWDDEEEPEPVSPPVSPFPESRDGTGYSPSLFSAGSPDAAGTIQPETFTGMGDASPPPRPPRGRSFMPGKQTIITAAVAVVVILLVVAGAMFVLPMLTGSGVALPGTGDAGPTPTPTLSVLKPADVVVKTQTVSIPPKGVYVHINYLGGFKGSYGIPDMMTTVPGNSGDRVWEVENATNHTVEASFEKLDGSGHPLLVEIYNDGQLLTSGSTTVGHGSVSLAVDMVTGKATEPVTSGIGSSTSTVTATVATPEPAGTPDPSVYGTTGATVTPTPAS